MNRKVKAAIVGLAFASLPFLTACEKLGEKSPPPEPTSVAQAKQEESPAEKVAKEICNNDTDPTNEGTVADCKKRGTTAFEYLKGRNLQGDENVRSTPAGFQKELTGLADKPKSLSKAVELTGVLVKFEQLAKEGGEIDGAQLRATFPNAEQLDINAGTEGEHAVDWDLNSQEERGGASFGKKTLKTQADIQEFLNGTSAESQAAREHVTNAIKAEGYGDDEVARALNGTGYVPVQIKSASQILGTTYFVDGKVLVLNKWRQAAEGDVYWLFFTGDRKLIRGALLRADCDNPDAITIMVVRPGMPPAPSVDQPPGEETCPPGTMPNPETGLCNPPPPPGDCDKPDDCKPPPPSCVGTGCNPKKPNEGSNHNGNAPQGGGQKQNSGSGNLDPPPPVVTTTRNNPPPPPNNPPTGSTPTTTGTPPPTNPGAGTSNSGTVPPPP